jgi:hypothetical protein
MKIEIFNFYISKMLNIIGWILFNIIISIIIIYILHYIWSYLKDTYSTKKTKDLVNTQIEKYKKIIAETQQNQKTVLSENEMNTMNDDLTKFLDNEIHSSFE